MFEFATEEQQEIVKSVNKLIFSTLPGREETIDIHRTRELFNSLSSIGITALAIPEEYDGLAATATTSMLVMEELASADLGPAIFISVHSMVSGIISRYASSEVKSNLLPKLASGKYLGAFALTEPQAGSDASNLKTTATKDGDSYVINGEKCYITSAGIADIYVVFARTGGIGGGGISAFIVEAEQQGLTISPPEKKMGCELSPIASLSFNQAKVPAQNLLGEINCGYKVALSGLAGGRVNIAACANGLSKTAIACTIAHLKERKQFGKQLGEFQGLQFMLADMQMKLEASRLLTWQAASELEKNANSSNNKLYPSMAKCFSTDAAMSITTDAVQLLGGAGYIKEYRVEKLMRDAKMLQIVEGTNQIQRMVIARELLEIR